MGLKMTFENRQNFKKIGKKVNNKTISRFNNLQNTDFEKNIFDSIFY